VYLLLLSDIIDVARRYEELEAISVSEKLSKLNTSAKNDEPSRDDDDDDDDDIKTDGMSAGGSQVVSSDAKNDSKLLGIY